MQKEIKELLKAIKPCSCEKEKGESTYVEFCLDGSIFQVSCICDKAVSIASVSDVIKTWNEEQS